MDSIRDEKCDTYTQFVLCHSTLAIDWAPQKMLLPTVLYHVFNSVRWRIETRDWLCPVCYWSFLPSFTKYTCSTAWLTRRQTRDQRLLRITGWKTNFIVTLVLFHRWRQEVKVVRIARFHVKNLTRITVYKAKLITQTLRLVWNRVKCLISSG